MGIGHSNTGMRLPIAPDEDSAQWTCIPTQFYGDTGIWPEGEAFFLCAWSAPWVCGQAFNSTSGHTFAKLGLAMPEYSWGPIPFNYYGIHSFKTNGRTKDPEISMLDVRDFINEEDGYEDGIFSEQFIHENSFPSVVVDNTNYGAFGIFGMVYAEKVSYYFDDTGEPNVVVSILGDVSCTPGTEGGIYYRDRKVKL